MDSWYCFDVTHACMEGLVKHGLLCGRTDVAEWLVPGREDEIPWLVPLWQNLLSYRAHMHLSLSDDL